MDSPARPSLSTIDQVPQETFGSTRSLSETLDLVTGFLRRQYPVFVVIVPCALALGLAYLATTPPLYTATATLLLDGSKVRVLQQQQQSIGDASIDSTQVETQAEILKSDNIASSVVKDQRLTDDPEFVGGTGGGGWSSIFGGSKSEVVDTRSQTEKTRSAVRAVMGRRTISRVGRTYVLDVSYTSLSPTRAAGVANAIAEAYIVDQLESKYQATRRAGGWLQDRITELRAQAMAADRAVLDYKEKNKIVDVGSSGSGSSGRLIGEQQLVDVNTQLMQARMATAEAKARLERIDEVMKHDIREATVADSLKNEIINRLRNQYLDLAARESTYSRRYGYNHLASVNLRTQMEELRRSIADELNRIAMSYRSDLEIAKAREESAEASLNELVSAGQMINRERLGLFELESRARVYRSIYDSFLQRYMESVQQLSFPITEARVISAASAPTQKSSPQGNRILQIAAALGLMASVGLGLLREALDRVFRRTRQVEDILKVSCLSVLPIINRKERKGKRRRLGGAAGGPPTITTKGGSAADPVSPEKAVAFSDNLMKFVMTDPLSAFAEGIRAIKVATDLHSIGKQSRIVGVTSTLANEGKSTVACNLAELMAHAGKKVILVDADLRKPTLARNLAPEPKCGLLEVLSGSAELEQVLRYDPANGLAMLPAIRPDNLIHSDEIVASDAFKSLIEQLRGRYDYVVVDLPPLAPIVDVRAVAHVVDSFVYVVEWGRTRISLVQRHLEAAPEVYDRLLGVVLNKANIKAMERYENYYGTQYYRKYYARYGYS